MIRYMFMAVIVGCGAFFAGEQSASADTSKALQEVFARAKKALETKNEALFKAQWHPTGYQKNLVGRSGIPGRAVFGQGARKGWYLRPDPKALVAASKSKQPIIPCLIWSTRRKRPVDKVYALLVRYKKRWVILGAGEKRKQVEALASKSTSFVPPTAAKPTPTTKTAQRTFAKSLFGSWRGIAQTEGGKRYPLNKIQIFYIFMKGGRFASLMKFEGKDLRRKKGSWYTIGDKLVLQIGQRIDMRFTRKGNKLMLRVPKHKRTLHLAYFPATVK